MLQNKNDDLEYQDNQTIIEECKEVFKGKDFIMESAAIPKVQKYFISFNFLLYLFAFIEI